MTMSRELSVTTPSDREIMMTRMLDAPRERVFDAWTTPEMLKQWMYGPEGHSLVVCEQDLRPGGALRFVWRLPDGRDMGMSGVYRDIARPERIVHTEIFDQDWTGGETVVTTTFTEQQAGQTTVTLTVQYSSREARDKALQSPMAEGMEAGFKRLETLLS